MSSIRRRGSLGSQPGSQPTDKLHTTNDNIFVPICLDTNKLLNDKEKREIKQNKVNLCEFTFITRKKKK